MKKLNNPEINESFICKIWEGGDLYYQNLKTNTGEDVQVLNPGKRNYDSGPDYIDSKIRIGNKVLAGDIEIHRNLSGWIDHKHKGDRNYYSVILQVVLWEDGEGNPKVKAGRIIPTVILSKHLTKSIHAIWREIISSPEMKIKLPCFDFNSSIPAEKLKSFLSKLSSERLSLRAKRIKERLDEIIFQDTGDNKIVLHYKKSKYWAQAFYEFIFEALGFSKNKEPMLMLSKNLTIKKISAEISEYGNKLFIIQALLFGYAGFLNEIKKSSGYPFELKQKWISLSGNNHRNILNKSDWKFFRLRPPNFPTRRLAYGSYIIYNLLFDDLLKKLIGLFKAASFDTAVCSKSIKNYFRAPEDIFWNNHYSFNSNMTNSYHLIGNERINDIVSNVIIPFVYLYSKVFDDEVLKKNVLTLFTTYRLSSSLSNRSTLNIIYKQLLLEKGIRILTPAVEQAVTQLYNFYCIRGKCDDCRIGNNIVKDSGYDYRIIFY